MRYLLHAPNVHTGGGLRLLQELLVASPELFSCAQLDERASADPAIPPTLSTRFVKRSFRSRISAEIKLKKECRDDDVVLCFHGLPPLFKLKGRAVVFLQNRLLVWPGSPGGYPPWVRIRLAMERLWLRACRRNADRYVVQSLSMAALLRPILPAEAEVLVIPFAPASPTVVNADTQVEGRTFDFLYVASGDTHKNHLVLLRAWRLLKEMGHSPSLALTLDRRRDPALCAKIEEEVRDHAVEIVNLGWLSKQGVATLYQSCGALIYPSGGESFGLPLIEANDAGLPIVASELDYVRDVVEPVQTFDPQSPLSIARAVVRFLKISDEKVPVKSAKKFLADALR